MQYKKLTPCDFCAYKTKSGCTVTPNSHYCTQAKNEFYAYLAKQKKGTK